MTTDKQEMVYPGAGPFREFLGRWHVSIQNFEVTSGEFYSLFEESLAKSVIPKATIVRTEWRERGLLSSKRYYLRVSRYDLYFEVCAAPLGTAFFFSWWFFRRISLTEKLLKIPLMWIPLLPLIVLFGTNTFYTYDTAIVFQELVHAATQEAIDKLTKEKGAKALTDEERKPVLSRFFNK